MADRTAIHLKLLTDISDNMVLNSPEYENFVVLMHQYVPKGILSKSRTLLDKLRCMETKGHLSPGGYEQLKSIAKDSGNNDLMEIIETAENAIRNIDRNNQVSESSVSSSTTSSRSLASGTSSSPGFATSGASTSTADASTSSVSSASGSSTSPASSSPAPSSKRKRPLEDDHPDPLYITRGNKSYYDTTDKTGYLLILNSTSRRSGTNTDVANIKSFFEERLRFDTFDPRSQEERDLTTEELNRYLEAAQEALNSPLSKKFYCFVCIILYHGNEDGIETRDGMKSVGDIIKMFANDQIPGFAGKPKVFFIQACRGLSKTECVKVDDADEILDSAQENEMPIDEADDWIKVPHEADTLVAYATTYGKQAFRRIGIGSWFISNVIKEFQENYQNDHVEEMLITVREKVASMYSEGYKSVQMPCVESTLTRRLLLK